MSRSRRQGDGPTRRRGHDGPRSRGVPVRRGTLPRAGRGRPAGRAGLPRRLPLARARAGLFRVRVLRVLRDGVRRGHLPVRRLYLGPGRAGRSALDPVHPGLAAPRPRRRPVEPEMDGADRLPAAARGRAGGVDRELARRALGVHVHGRRGVRDDRARALGPHLAPRARAGPGARQRHARDGLPTLARPRHVGRRLAPRRVGRPGRLSRGHRRGPPSAALHAGGARRPPARGGAERVARRPPTGGGYRVAPRRAGFSRSPPSRDGSW